MAKFPFLSLPRTERKSNLLSMEGGTGGHANDPHLRELVGNLLGVYWNKDGETLRKSSELSSCSAVGLSSEGDKHKTIRSSKV